MEENPFKDLKIAGADFLDSLSGRSLCPKCQKSRKYYCYTCYVPVQGIEDRVPKVKLPLQVDIIKHPSECDGKSTAAHAGVISPDYVTIYTYPCIPDYEDRNRVLLVFPGPESTTLKDLAKEMKCCDVHLTKKVQNNNATCHSAVEEACSVLSNDLPLQKNLTESDVDNSEKCVHVGPLDSEKDCAGRKRTLEDLNCEPERDGCKKLHAEVNYLEFHYYIFVQELFVTLKEIYQSM
ncbi:hypothetical protein CHS0354_005033 [Potamilus streckersoni]|uniref:tRNA-uridine aminocarboxypropyltransferase 1 n=1 Tax=Potamilus streckersoni TaxID=2493646 RepID=A0AAE0SSS1_9BIVA|nr:hypothetical protein CHS0354_005033 [Potamilus streckersoni]